jgi:hypothetical protein
MTGCTFITGRGQPAGGGSVSVEDIAPLVLLDLDWAAQATQDFKGGGDGNYTIAGKTWTVARTVDADTFGIVNGVGLRYNAAANAGNAYGSGTRTATNIVLPLVSLTGFDSRFTYLLEMFLSSITQAVSGDQVHIGMLLDTAGTDRYMAAMRRNSAGNPQTAEQNDTTANGDAHTDDAIGLRVDGRGGWGVSGTYDAGNDAFPSPYLHTGGSQAMGATFNIPFDVPQSFFVHAFVNGSNAGTHDITVKRTRISRIVG